LYPKSEARGRGGEFRRRECTAALEPRCIISLQPSDEKGQARLGNPPIESEAESNQGIGVHPIWDDGESVTKGRGRVIIDRLEDMAGKGTIFASLLPAVPVRPLVRKKRKEEQTKRR